MSGRMGSPDAFVGAAGQLESGFRGNNTKIQTRRSRKLLGVRSCALER